MNFMSEKKDPFFRTMIEEFNMNKMCRTTNQTGRSMIEMLGVLAIIGVLSVGGIAGYSKAMMKFKINKTIDQISQISQNIRTLYARQRNYRSLGTTGSPNNKILYKANLAPREMFEGSGTDYVMTNVFGGEVLINGNCKNDSGDCDYKSFSISLGGLPEEACIELATQDWGSDSNSGLISVGANYSAGYFGCEGSTSGLACPGGSVVSVPMPVDVAVDACYGNNSWFTVHYY